jgi:AcrR family transcriptional regulator
MGRNSLKEIRQKEIIKNFYDVARKEGLENASIAKIARQMKVNPSLIIHYFETKEDLVYHLIDYILVRYKKIYRHDPVTGENADRNLIKLLNRLFSKEWNSLIDDGVFYSCFSITFRNDKIRKKYKELHDSLRTLLAEIIHDYSRYHNISIDDPSATAEMIFIILEGSYYYLSLVDDRKEYLSKLNRYREEAFKLLDLPVKDIVQ